MGDEDSNSDGDKKQDNNKSDKSEDRFREEGKDLENSALKKDDNSTDKAENLKSKEKDAIEQVNGFEINKDKDNSSQAVIDLDSSRSGALGLKDVLNQQVGEPQTVETKDISKSDILITDKTEEINEQNPKEGSSTEIKS